MYNLSDSTFPFNRLHFVQFYLVSRQSHQIFQIMYMKTNIGPVSRLLHIHVCVCVCACIGLFIVLLLKSLFPEARSLRGRLGWRTRLFRPADSLDLLFAPMMRTDIIYTRPCHSRARGGRLVPSRFLTKQDRYVTPRLVYLQRSIVSCPRLNRFSIPFYIYF